MSSYIRHGTGTVRPYLYGGLDLPRFVEKVFGAVEIECQWMGDAACHYEARIGDSTIVIEAGEHPPERGPAAVYVYVEDVDATWKRAMEAGAETINAPEDKPYGERGAGIRDTFGNTWWISTYQG